MTYLDHASTSPLSPEVDAAMAPWRGLPLNPSSVHAAGRRAAAALERAREDVAELLDRDPRGIVFCSGATEANHAALWGHARSGAQTVAASVGLEHPSVNGAIAASGLRWSPLDVGADGRLRLAFGADLLVCMAANHETGVVQPFAEALASGARVHVDATHAAGRIALPLRAAASVTLSAHKLGGPVGIGALSLPSGDPFPAWIRGSGQERGRRSGTPDVVSAIGFAAACRLARERLEVGAARRRALDLRLREAVTRLGARPVGDWALTVPGTTCFVLPGILGETVVQAMDLDGIAISSGAACSSGSVQPSPVLLAMGDPEPRGAVRVSLGLTSTSEDVDRLAGALLGFVERRRAGLTGELG